MSILPDWLTGYDAANADAAAAADLKLRKMNASDYTGAEAAQVAKDYAAQDASTGGFGEDVQRAEIDQTFTDTLDAEAKGILGTPLGIFWAEVKSLLKALPWWVWAILGLALFTWLGGWRLLRGILGR